MVAPVWSKRLLLGLALVAFSVSAVRGAIGPGNVLVLYNTASTDGVELANYYAQVHPGVRLLGLNNVTTAEQVTDDYYLGVIRPQIINSGLLNSSVDVIVTTKGLPLRVYTDNANPGSYTDPFGVSRTVGTGWWRPYSSLESELTRIDVISTWQQMGDQTYYSQKGLPNYPQPACNPYYGSSTAFNYDTYSKSGYGGMRLSSRLDGFTTADVKTAINKAQQAFLITNSRWIVVDDDPNSVGQDMMVQLKDNVLTPKSQAYVYNNTDAAITTAPGPVIGYVSHGINDGPGGLEPGYIAGQLSFSLANGAVFQTHESFNASTFNLPENQDQGLVAEWLAIGGTAGVGHVYEPYSAPSNEANEDQMFNMLLGGFTWAEAAWSSMQQLSYVNTVVGDPLMTWKKVIPGDSNMDGVVGSADLARLGANWGARGQAGGYMWGQGDFNGDGLVGSADLAVLGANWGQRASWALSGPLASGSLDIDAFLVSIPEPTTMILALTGLLVFLMRIVFASKSFRL
jgi:uncharacterized protein (TIGR03790 family)